jgi:hypothetical protein
MNDDTETFAVKELVADYDTRSPASRTLMTVLGTVLVIALLGGAVLGVSVLMKDTTAVTSEIEIDGAAQLAVVATTADITVVEGDADVITARARVTSGIRETRYELGRRGDELKIVSDCLGWLSPGCGVALTLEVPKGFPVLVTTTTGDVTADDVEQGVLTVATTSGDVRAHGITVDEFSVETGSGDVSAVFAAQPFAFKASTDDGDVAATVPSGDRTYVVTTASASGDVSSDLESDEDGEGFVRVSSTSGDIAVRVP